jgi:hypothetical protein
MADVTLPPGKTLEDLRAPFDRAVIGLLPKPTTKDGSKRECSDCGSYHAFPAIHLDYVGHAAVTDRLLNVDPHWTWEPFAVDAQGLPALDRDGGLWIRLTVLGQTRIGYGDGRSRKEVIGDAIRNAAMRFGVALDLWTKNELESRNPNATDESTPPTAQDYITRMRDTASLPETIGLKRDAGLAGLLPDVVTVPTLNEGPQDMPLGEAFDIRIQWLRDRQAQQAPQ